jgi:hypothetical protein
MTANGGICRNGSLPSETILIQKYNIGLLLEVKITLEYVS